MRNILLISTIYPRPEGNIGTHVCHFFTREWAKYGYNVRAVHIQAVYPRVFYLLARIAQKRIAAKASAIVYTRKEERPVRYEMDNVQICRIPVFKPIPHWAFTNKSIKSAEKEITKFVSESDFEPDIIIGHFPNPQLRLLYDLKKIYPKSTTCEVLHLPEELGQLKSVYGKFLNIYMESVDVWGFRFKHLRELFTEQYGQIKHSFICYSGVPGDYVLDGHKIIKDSVSEFIFVGEMIERKYPVKVLDALRQAYPDNNFHINFIGEGSLKQNLNDIVRKENLEDCVSVLGRIPRDSIKEKYDEADCFIMISKGEAYGLVYLEAMARGCITIASRNEGFDGVIIDGENGFLCEAGNSQELVQLINHIRALSPQERTRISDNAIETAKNLTDKKAAEKYINDVTKLLSNEY